MIRTKEQLIQEIIRLEIECSMIVAQAGGNIYNSNLFPKYLKVSRQVQKLQAKL